MAKRLRAIGLESTESRRREYRELLFTAAGIGEFVSGWLKVDATEARRIQKDYYRRYGTTNLYAALDASAPELVLRLADQAVALGEAATEPVPEAFKHPSPTRCPRK